MPRDASQSPDGQDTPARGRPLAPAPDDAPTQAPTAVPDDAAQTAIDNRRRIEDGTPVSEIIDLKPPGDVAREALNRARAAAKAKGLYPGKQRRRILAEQPRSGPGKDGRDPKLFAETLAALLQQRGWVQEVSVGGVIGRWREVVGDDIADHCEPETFTNNALVVRASSTAWATQVRLLIPRLLELMEQEVGPDVVQEITVLGPAGPGFGRGFRSVKGRGARDTFG